MIALNECLIELVISIKYDQCYKIFLDNKYEEACEKLKRFKLPFYESDGNYCKKMFLNYKISSSYSKSTAHRGSTTI